MEGLGARSFRLVPNLSRLVLTAMLAWVVPGPSAPAADLGELAVQESVLRTWHLEPTAESLTAYLRQLHPDAEQRRRALGLVEQLGSRDFFEREAATQELLAIPILPTPELVAASKGADAEVRWRAKRILAKRDPDRAPLLYAVLRTIELKRLPETAGEVLRAIPVCDKDYLKAAAHAAVVSAARPHDAPMLREALRSEYAEVQAAAASALGKALGKAASDDLYALVDSPGIDEGVALAAARALADQGDRRSLSVLVELLSSDDVDVRAESCDVLREASGARFGFLAYDLPERRFEAAAKWKSWVETDGATVPLSFPLKRAGLAGGALSGHTLLAFGYQNKVAEYDPAGKEVWTYQARGAWSAEKLPGGNILIAAYYDNKILEVSPERRVVWEYEAHRPLNARPLPGGNVLISVASSQKVIEVSRDKQTVWEYATSGNCRDAHRLANGNTLVAAGNLVIEVTPDKKVVWEFQNAQPFGLHPLSNGHLLIADFNGRVIEVTREKEIVWEYAVTKPGDAYRLANGNTLVTTYSHFHEVTPDKKTVWSKPGCRYGTARR